MPSLAAWLAAMLAWLAGVALQLQQREIGPPVLAVGAVGAGLVLLLAGVRWRRLQWLALAGLLLLGFGSTAGRAGLRLAEALDPALEGRDLQLTGVVAALPQRAADGVRFRFAVEEARDGAARVAVPRLVALGWYQGAHPDAARQPPQDALRAGERWRFVVRLRQPHGNLNPQGFDVELALFEQGVRAVGYVRDDPPQRLAEAAGHPVERLRQRLRDAVFAQVGDARAAGVLAALTVGDQGAIAREDWELFRATGLGHLMSISGLHVTMFAWLAGGLIGALWRRSARAVHAVPAPQAARWGGLTAAAAYAVLAGWGVPAQRTVLMLASAVLLRSLGRRWPWPLVLLAAATVVTLADPWALLQAGFWLSFAAVGLLMASEPAQAAAAPAAGQPWTSRARALLSGAGRTQLVASVGLAPLTLLFFQQVSVVGFLANLVAIPLITLVVTPLALAGALLPWLWGMAAALLQGLTLVLDGLASWPWAVWTVPAAAPWAQGAALLAGALLVMPLPWRLRALALPLALPMLLGMPARPEPGRFELLAADVGQGSAVLVRTARHLLVYDAGPLYGRDSDAGERVLLPLLRARGEPRIDTLVLSHRDSDHVGGARALLSALPVGELLSSLKDGHPLRALAARERPCLAGQGWTWDGVRFELLHPRPAELALAARPNAASCVLRIVDAAGRSALLTGDIEREQELALVERVGAALKSELLLAPHHGSRSSSSEEFLARVQPQVVVVQAGYRNRFGHPAPEVLARYRGAGATVVASPSCGAWQWRAEGAQCERDAARRYWHHRAADVPE
ncbi:DNA internalization-related competence protein ComEC/Rec2 [Piscinibacter sp.]|uniref:DNA internalization-related competence protein ComEC/Rec2 n=1 Tax=Piscinibacter sp. TaxID=1903157 RepID=UPI00338D6183